MNGAPLLDRVCATLSGYFELGNEVREAAGAKLVRNREHALIYDANHVCAVRVSTSAPPTSGWVGLPLWRCC